MPLCIFRFNLKNNEAAEQNSIKDDEWKVVLGQEEVVKKEHHETVHLDDNLKKFKCEECGKGFNENQKLSDHRMNVHLKLRPYKCRYGCEMAYNDRSNRNHHEKRKHGELFS